MQSSPKKAQWIIRLGIVLAALGFVGAACVSSDRPRPTCAELLDGGTPPPEVPDGSVYWGVPTTDAQAITDMGMRPDPGPSCTNCAQGDDLEIMTIARLRAGVCSNVVQLRRARDSDRAQSGGFQRRARPTRRPRFRRRTGASRCRICERCRAGRAARATTRCTSRAARSSRGVAVTSRNTPSCAGRNTSRGTAL